jgi:hypothetical protein
VVVNNYNPSTCRVEAGRLRVRGQPGLHRETLSQTKNMKYFKVCQNVGVECKKNYSEIRILRNRGLKRPILHVALHMQNLDLKNMM